MTPLLFDTDVLSSYLKARALERQPRLVRLVYESLQGEGLFISSVTKYELLRGLRKLQLQGQGRRKEVSVKRLLDAAYAISPDALGGAACNVAADLWARASMQGLKFGEADLIITAMALVSSRQLVTCDSKHVEKLEAVGFQGEVKLLQVKPDLGA